MAKENSAKTISVIALIISIIALILVLLHLWCCCSHCGCCPWKHAQEAQPAVEQAEAEPEVIVEAEEQEPAPVAEPAVGGEEAPKAYTHPDGATKRKDPGAPFIDLGLPSGTKWRIINEEGLMTYDEAIEKFGKQVPTQKQFTELYEKCKWKELKEGGYKVIGPNGNHIIFPFTGFINCTGEFRMGNELGDYWTSTMKGEEAYRVAMNANGVKIMNHPCCYARGIRLVEK